MKLSHSSKDKFLSCGEKWRLHYQEKLRSPKLYSSLFFGSALDEAFSRLLLDKKKLQFTEEELEMTKFTPEELFLQKMEQVENNGKIEKLSDNVNCDYYTSDYEEALLTKQALEKLAEYAPDVSNIPAFMAEAKNVIKAKKKLSESDQKLYNYVTWLTLIDKGLLIIAAYREQVMPQIFEVYSIQERVSLKNDTYIAYRKVFNSELGQFVVEEYETCDELTGLIDFTCSFVDDPGTMYVCDNKTSSKPYKASQTGESHQLATYCEYKGTTKAAYVVAEKKLYKKAPVIHTQILKDDIPEEIFSATFAQFEDVLYSISTSSFEKNFGACYEYGRLCPYYKLCKYGNADGLVDMKEKREEAEV